MSSCGVNLCFCSTIAIACERFVSRTLINCIFVAFGFNLTSRCFYAKANDNLLICGPVNFKSSGMSSHIKGFLSSLSLNLSQKNGFTESNGLLEAARFCRALPGAPEIPWLAGTPDGYPNSGAEAGGLIRVPINTFGTGGDPTGGDGSGNYPAGGGGGGRMHLEIGGGGREDTIGGGRSFGIDRLGGAPGGGDITPLGGGGGGNNDGTVFAAVLYDIFGDDID